MPTIAERNAGVDAAHKGIENIIHTLVPGFWQGKADQILAQHPDLVLQVVDGVLNAAEKERAKVVVPAVPQH